MQSLRGRAVVGAAIWAAVTIALVFFALLAFFNAIALDRFDSTLQTRHRQLVIALANGGRDQESVEFDLIDPEYSRTYSGRYWQFENPMGETIVSRSLFDVTLDPALPEGDAPRFWEGEGPDGPVRGLTQLVRLEDGPPWVVTVADSLATLSEERSSNFQSLAAAFTIVGVLIVAGASLLVSAAMRPMRRLRQEVSHRWDSGEALNPGAYPSEVAPLVADINLLLDRNRKVIDSARRQAADLAHALKTPTAVLRNEIDSRMTARDRFDEAREALDRIDAQILRSLARIRAGNAAAAGYRTDLAASVERLRRLFSRIGGARPLELQFEVAEGMTIAMDRQDIEEALGNLLENAIKYGRGVVRLTAVTDGTDAVIHVDDDGPGVPPERREEALMAGGRLDTSVAGTGLGLAIVVDLVTAYDGKVELGQAPGLGGLRVTLRVPAMRGMMERLLAGGAPVNEA